MYFYPTLPSQPSVPCTPPLRSQLFVYFIPPLPALCTFYIPTLPYHLIVPFYLTPLLPAILSFLYLLSRPFPPSRSCLSVTFILPLPSQPLLSLCTFYPAPPLSPALCHLSIHNRVSDEWWNVSVHSNKCPDSSDVTAIVQNHSQLTLDHLPFASRAILPPHLNNCQNAAGQPQSVGNVSVLCWCFRPSISKHVCCFNVEPAS